MSKKKAEQHKEEETKLVAVEMTEEQKEKFVDFMAAEEEAKEVVPAKPAAPTKFFQIDLSTGHNINGVPYGPGKTRVPEHLVGLLLDQENKHKQGEIRLQHPAGKSIQLQTLFGQATPIEVK